ncbi:MAG: hypothetical protein IT376_07760 [Polyangiaceae bacterium]|nr:hypothetical protein [Polyangiaceae bacterium]
MRVASAVRLGLGLVLAVLAGGGQAACSEPYRVGEHVWVEWEKRDHPAHILERKGRSRYRVRFDGYDSRWDEDVGLERIKGRVVGAVELPPPPERVARALGAAVPRSSASAAPSGSAAVVQGLYKEGDRVRVRWRGSIYGATVLTVEGPDRFRVRYDAHEPAWDETVSLERIAGRR